MTTNLTFRKLVNLLVPKQLPLTLHQAPNTFKQVLGLLELHLAI